MNVCVSGPAQAAVSGVDVVYPAGQGDCSAVGEELLRPGPVPRLLDRVGGIDERQHRHRRQRQLLIAHRSNTRTLSGDRSHRCGDEACCPAAGVPFDPAAHPAAADMVAAENRSWPTRAPISSGPTLPSHNKPRSRPLAVDTREMITTDRGGQALQRHPGIHGIIGPPGGADDQAFDG
jgi:hypothetical protein